jgi:hypothetical protein
MGWDYILRQFYSSNIMTNMVDKDEFLQVEIFQNNLDYDESGIIMMVLSFQLASDKKFLKLPS